jgi:hypothetical protein
LKRAILGLVLISVCSLAASAETVRGVVENGTTKKPSAGDEIILKKIAPGVGMQDVGKTKTNAKGEFSFNVPASQQPYVLWVQHQQVTYPKVAMAGGGPVAVQVFDASAGVNDITLQEHMIVLQTSPAGDSLKVDTLFTLNNQSSPPMTKNGQHTFDLYLPDNVKVEESTAQTAGSMALKTPVVPTGEKNKYFFGYPLRPGKTQFHVTYSVPYSGKLDFDPRLTLPTDNMLVVTPASISFTPEDKSLYTQKTDPQIPKSVSLFAASNVNSKSKVAFEIQGTGELPREQAGGAEGGGQAQASNRPGGGLGVPNEQPDPLRNGQWLFLGVLTVFLTAGAVYVYTAKPQPAMVAAKPAKAGKNRSGSALLEAMKEELFQLESDRLEGKISQQEYESSKAALDKTLQRAVKRQATAK